MTRPIAAAAALLAALALGACSDDDNPFRVPGGNGGDGDDSQIAGQVTASGVGVEDVRVVLLDRDSTLTDDGGFYSFDDLEAGEYTVIVRLPVGLTVAPGDSPVREVDLEAADTVFVDWFLQPTVSTP